jgi:hypothetical protein
LRQLFEDRARPDASSSDEDVLQLLGLPTVLGDASAHAVDEYWQRAVANLATRQIRLVLVADIIPPELQQIVELLNENLVRAGCSRSRSRSTLAKVARRWSPRVIGRTAVAEDVKQVSGGAPVRQRRVTMVDISSAAGGVPAHRAPSP